jgi:hypothetical protein
MKTSKRYIVKAEKIHSMEDLRIEKLRLRLEIMKTEENIHSGYRDILQALTLKNLATTMINDVSASSSLLGKAFVFGKAVMAKRKKKKQDKLKEITADPQP